MFKAIIEFSGFLSSWDTHAFIKAKKVFWAFSLSYKIVLEISIIYNITRFCPLFYKLDSFI